MADGTDLPDDAWGSAGKQCSPQHWAACASVIEPPEVYHASASLSIDLSRLCWTDVVDSVDTDSTVCFALAWPEDVRQVSPRDW